MVGKFGLGGKIKKCGKNCMAKLWALKPHVQKVATFFLHDNENFRPEKLNIKIIV